MKQNDKKEFTEDGAFITSGRLLDNCDVMLAAMQGIHAVTESRSLGAKMAPDGTLTIKDGTMIRLVTAAVAQALSMTVGIDPDIHACMERDMPELKRNLEDCGVKIDMEHFSQPGGGKDTPHAATCGEA